MKSSSSCPIHSYQYWISKRVHQFLSSKYLTRLSIKLNEECWEHLNHQYCPIKAPKVVTLYRTKYSITDAPDTLFKHIKSLTAEMPAYEVSHENEANIYTEQFITSFRNLTSIDLRFYNLGLLSKTTTPITKLLLPRGYNETSVSGTLANSILNSNIIPTHQMPNLQTFHVEYTSSSSISFDEDTLVTRLVVHDSFSKMKSLINNIPPTVDFIQFKPTFGELLRLTSKLNVAKLTIDDTGDIPEKVINAFACEAYRYETIHIYRSAKHSTNRIIIIIKYLFYLLPFSIFTIQLIFNLDSKKRDNQETQQDDGEECDLKEIKRKKEQPDNEEQQQQQPLGNESDLYTEDELESIPEKDLIVICESLVIRPTDRNEIDTKDSMIKQIINVQNGQLAIKRKMVDDNPLYNYNKGQVEYSLPWPIIGRILDLVWTGTSICYCMGDEEKNKESTTMKSSCPSHSFEYYTASSNTYGHKSMRRCFPLLGVSKRVHQFLSKYMTRLSFKLNEECWEHLNNQYCPIKAPKVVTLYDTKYAIAQAPDTCIFNSVEGLKLRFFPLKSHQIKKLHLFFKDIKSLTAETPMNERFHEYMSNVFTKQFITGFRNLTSINLRIYHSCYTDLGKFFSILSKTATSITKLLLPMGYTQANVKGALANSIINSNIVPPNQLPNLQTFHVEPHTFSPISFDENSLVTRLVIHSSFSKMKSFINKIPPTVDCIQYKPTYCELIGPSDIKGLNQWNVDNLIIDDKNSKITEIIINAFASETYQYSITKLKRYFRRYTFTKVRRDSAQPTE
ncbi:hypothetical protein DFA_06323 [Cavenderia fasciculata]|uniref:Uncharacterized protein n=1 Tax=Cavenderia fasciculata TaxID=261658 RepID=F4PKQ2_CACFS|nr:uncharacterized protein DFA_06323 [Cavenderia fasciculata]EGG24176.1 hypothetical protein DFA_06323 [Cavenderia fasciculata]|eukprot:XP_004362027.1 hypothetical protein DFA_06323 [Cavenderia fasciculata]